jgi:Xaa-Pro dipeptidase
VRFIAHTCAISMERGKGMSSKIFVEDTSIKGRKEEIGVKVERIKKLLASENLDALYLTRQSNFAWITAGASNMVTICTEDGVASILVTKEGKRYAITNAVEEARMKEEQLLGDLGFEVLSQPWYENHNEEMIRKIAGGMDRVGADVHFSTAKMIQGKINPLRYSLTHNEICRYQYLGDYMSEALEKYLATVKPGMTEYEITGGVAEALWPKQIDQVLFLVAADERNIKHRHAVPTSNRLKKSLMVSCNGRYKGLITTTTRMVYFGKPPAGLLPQFEKTAEIECRMIAATRPGVDDLVPHMIGKDAYKEFGFEDMYYKHHQGGPQGYYNREFLVSEHMHGITQVDQCYCYNPVVSGTKTEDAFIAMEKGPLFITKPFSFPKLTITVGGYTMERPGMLVV